MEGNSQNELPCLEKNKIIDYSTNSGKEDSTSLSNRQSDDSLDNSDSFKVPKIENLVTRNVGTDASSSSKKDFNEKSIKKKSVSKDKNKASTVEYEVPTWSKTPGDKHSDTKYKLSEIKGGVVVTEIELIKPYYIFGREDTNDIVMMHPTVSRRHAALQFGDPSGSGNNSWHLFDMNSTHGTFVNKSQRVHGYTRLEDGFMFKLGCSSRFFLLDKIVPKVSAYEKYRMSIRDNERDDEDEHDDDDDDDDYDEDEDLHNKNMVNALKQWFQNEAQDPVFNIEKIGDYVCKIKLPLKDIYGDDSEDYEGIGEGKTKDEAIYEAVGKCWEYLESIGVTPAGIKRSKNWKENDYYDSDEDPFFDRTGDLEKKRIKRMKEDETVNSKKIKSKTPTELHNSLFSERENLVQYIKYLEEEIAKKKDYEDEELGEDIVDCKKTFLADLAKKKVELAEIDSRLTNLKNID